jgi:hypothetical protein
VSRDARRPRPSNPRKSAGEDFRLLGADLAVELDGVIGVGLLGEFDEGLAVGAAVSALAQHDAVGLDGQVLEEGADVVRRRAEGEPTHAHHAQPVGIRPGSHPGDGERSRRLGGSNCLLDLGRHSARDFCELLRSLHVMQGGTEDLRVKVGIILRRSRQRNEPREDYPTHFFCMMKIFDSGIMKYDPAYFFHRTEIRYDSCLNIAPIDLLPVLLDSSLHVLESRQAHECIAAGPARMCQADQDPVRQDPAVAEEFSNIFVTC